MCGIAGIWHIKNECLNEETLVRMRDCLTHRGPDDAGVWINKSMGLGHRRLSIIDTSQSGHQPMIDEVTGSVIVYNGEVYNFKEIRKELEAMGVAFKSTCDTEVVLKAYRVWGSSCLSHFNGMFAFALYDMPAHRLFIARDRAGQKPLFYHKSQSKFMFASELKALFADKSFPRSLNLKALNFYLAYGYVPGDMCILKDVHKLPPAHWLIYNLSSNRITIQRYWQLPKSEDVQTSDMDALTDQLCEHLKDSVKMRLVADVPVGILLSGGIDSSLVTAMAAEHSSKPVKTFTVSFPGHGGYDEAPFGRKVADYFDTDHTELIADPLSIDTLDEMAKQFDEPIADSSMIPTYLISKKISQYAKVALSGDGADELFGGYPHHSWIRQQDCLRRFVPRAFRCSLRKASLRLWPPGLRGRNYFMGCLSDLHGNIAQINTFFDPLIRKQLLTGVCSDKEFQYNSPEAYKISLCDCGQSPLQSATRVDFMTYLPEDILVKVDRAAMLASLEIRSPFLDHRIIEFAFGQVPDNLRATLNRRKILLRQLSERLMPNQLDLKRKQGFSMPIHEEFSGKWGDYCQQLLCKATDNLFDNSVIQRMITRQKKGFFNSDRLFALMIFELWRRHYQISV